MITILYGELQSFLDGDIDTSVNYSRYWHGYLPIYRTLLLLFNISEIRMILLVVFITLFIYLIYLLKNKLNIFVALIFAFSLIFEDYFYVSYSLESAPIFLTMMISCIVLLKKIDKIKDFYLYIFIVSCIANFVDFLTVPLITLAIPLYIFILYKQKENEELDAKYFIKLVIKSSCVWILGYAMTWLSKWIIYDLIYHEGLIKSSFEQVLYRSSRYNSFSNDNLSGILSVFCIKNVFYIYIYYVLSILFIIIFINRKRIFMFNSITKIYSKIAPIFLISLMPFVWYIALKNHTLLHSHFVYRHMLIFLCGFLIIFNNFLTVKRLDTL